MWKCFLQVAELRLRTQKKVARAHLCLLQTLKGAVRWDKLRTPAYTPGDSQTSWGYSTNPVLHLYISSYVTVNKPVLSYLLLCLLPQWWPRSGCTLCTVHCTFVHSHVGSYKHWTLSLRLRSEVFISILQCALHRLQLNKRFSSTIPLRNPQIFFFVFLCWKLAVATTALNFEHKLLLPVFFFFCAVRPWADIQPSTHFLYQVFNI